MKRVCFIVNPVSGRGSGSKAIAAIKAAPEFQSGEWSIVETHSADFGSGHSAKAARDKIDIAAAVGGDGTLSAVMQGVLGSDTALAVVPAGTGNDFARHLGIDTSIEKALETIRSGRIERMDIGWAGEVPFLNSASCGFDAVVGERINKGYRWLKGPLAYNAAIIQTLLSYKAGSFRLVIDGKEVLEKAMLCCVSNASSYGGGLKIAPDASIHDGLLDVVLVRELGKLEFIKQLPNVRQGGHMTHPAVVHFHAKEVQIECEPSAPVLCDGDFVGHTPNSFRVEPNALKVVLPQ